MNLKVDTVEQLNGGRVRVKAEGKTYSYFQQGRDGNSLPLMVAGKTYECQIKTNEKNGVTYNNIVNFKEVVQQAAPQQAVGDKQDSFDRAYIKDIAVALINNGMTDEDAIGRKARKIYLIATGQSTGQEINEDPFDFPAEQ